MKGRVQHTPEGGIIVYDETGKVRVYVGPKRLD